MPSKARVMRQAYAGLLWSKQFYHYVVKDWLDGDPHTPPPPPQRKTGRNWEWRHVFCRDVLSMPDKWEYPWFASWDLAFHMIPLAHVDPQFAKDQLLLLMREWYMHPNGQLPAYEFAFGDVNPPVHAWACWRVYKIAGNRQPGGRDRLFLERAFQKLMINFTWWVNRKDVEGHNIFAGGFLGLDNIGIFDRSKPLPGGGRLDQADGTAWMAFFCATMLSMALELARMTRPTRTSPASSSSTSSPSPTPSTPWAARGCGTSRTASTTTSSAADCAMPSRCACGRWSASSRCSPARSCARRSSGKLQGLLQSGCSGSWSTGRTWPGSLPMKPRAAPGSDAHLGGGRYLLAIPSKEKLQRVLRYVLDEKEFLSPHGIRSLSRGLQGPARMSWNLDGQHYEAAYTPRPSPTRPCSAETPTGAGRSGSR